MRGTVIWMIIGVLSICYGLTVMRTGSGTGFFVIWMMLGLLAFVCAAACRYHLWRRLPAVLRVSAGVILLVLVLMFGVIEARILTGFRMKGKPDLDALIVLGAQVYEHGPSRVLKSRLDTAAAYLEENEKTICIVSGGQGYNEPAPEAEIMKQYLMDQGIEASRIITESASRNTVQNIKNCLELPGISAFADKLQNRSEDSDGEKQVPGSVDGMQEGSTRLLDPKQDSIGIVTNNFHVYRGCALAKKAGIQNVSGIAAPSNRLYLPNNLLREFFGVTKDLICGNMNFF